MALDILVAHRIEAQQLPFCVAKGPADYPAISGRIHSVYGQLLVLHIPSLRAHYVVHRGLCEDRVQNPVQDRRMEPRRVEVLAEGCSRAASGPSRNRHVRCFPTRPLALPALIRPAGPTVSPRTSLWASPSTPPSSRGSGMQSSCSTTGDGEPLVGVRSMHRLHYMGAHRSWRSGHPPACCLHL